MRGFAQSIVETIRHPLLVLDTELRVRGANRVFHQTFRVPDDGAAGRPLFALGGLGWDVPRLRESLRQVVATGQALEGFEVEHDFPLIGRKVLLLNANQVFREEDQAPMILLAMEDVTDKKQAQDELHRLNAELEDRVRDRTAQLEAANRELEAFSYSVSHDLRAPLRAIDGFSQELLSAYADRLDERGKHYLERVRAGSQRMALLIDDLLQLSRLSRGEMKTQRVDLTALAGTVAAELRRQEPGRQVHVEIEPGLTAWGDPGLLRVALENLLGNAWKFTAKKPDATVAFGRTEHQGQPAFFVRDDGAGFDMKFAGKLFGAFQRLHKERDFPGTGIGLATVQRVVHRHGGRVWAEGAIGQGAAFYFTLPEGGGT
jgi:signal transduction histidine kinase